MCAGDPSAVSHSICPPCTELFEKGEKPMTETRGNPAMLKAAAVLGTVGVVLLLFATSGACQGTDPQPILGTTAPVMGTPDYSTIRSVMLPEVRLVPKKSRGMKAALAVLAVGRVLDTVSTVQALNRGAVEANPLYGKRPSVKRLVAMNLPVVGLGYVLHKVAPRNPKLAKGIAYTIGGVGAALAMSNARKGRR